MLPDGRSGGRVELRRGAGGEEALELVGGHRRGEEVALRAVAPELAQRVELRAVSTPSAIALRPRLLAMSTIADTIAVSSSSAASPSTNERSTLIASTGRPLRRESDE